MILINQKIREQISINNLKYWQVADKLNINDGNFSRLLRKQLSKEKEEQILKIIEELKEANKNDQK